MSKTFSLARKRCTDIKENKKVYLPKAMGIKKEAILDVRMQSFRDIFKEYKEENCKEDGKQHPNMNKKQLEGLKSLKKKIKDGLIIVCPTDKSGKFCVTTPKAYLKMGDSHTSKDKEVNRKELARIQSELNGHMSMWGRCFSLGDNHNHRTRIRETTLNYACSVPPLYIMVKDHKVIKPGKLP